MVTPYKMNGSIIELCRFAQRVSDADGIHVEYFVNKPEGTSIPVDQSAYEWAEGLYVPDDYSPDDILSMGEQAWKSTYPAVVQSQIGVISAILGPSPTTSAAEQTRHAIQMFAASLPEEQMLEIPSVFPAWETGIAYSAGNVVSYGYNDVGDPQLYKVVQAHTSAAEWKPSETPALYDAIGLTEEGYPVWSQPSGAHDAYSTGDIVSYNGVLYRSLIDGNTYSPDAYPQGWEVYKE